jgi:N-acetylmuramoyl-L-alanine amidase
MWPAADHTRLTIETSGRPTWTSTTLKGPDRLVINLDAHSSGGRLTEQIPRTHPDNPWVRKLSVTQPDVGKVQLMIEFQADTRADIFALLPTEPYQHRLVVDLIPRDAPDPLAGLIDRRQPNEQNLDALIRQLETTPERLDRPITIAIDPGHGGEDPGAIGPGGTMEKDVTLMIAQRLFELTRADPTLRAMLTREGDWFVPLGARVAKAKRVKADLFVSIHADAFSTSTARGSSVFVLSETGASSSAARWLASKENSADRVGGINLSSTPEREVRQLLLDLSTTAQITDSLHVGNSVLEELRGVGRLHKPNVERAAFAVLKAPDIPSILVETAFISNPEEEFRLTDDAHQNALATALFRGIKRWLERHNARSRPAGRI